MKKIDTNIIIYLFILLIISVLVLYNKKKENFTNTTIQTVSARNNIANLYNTTDITYNNLSNMNEINADQLIAENIKGIIVAWSGIINNIPEGWGLCDGTIYTDLSGNPVKSPDLRSKFIVGASKNNSSTFSKNNSSTKQPIPLTPKNVFDFGGEEKHTLQMYELPAHSHNMPFLSQAAGANSNNPTYGGVSAPVGNGCWWDYTIGVTGNIPHSSHENMNPYIALAYIIKIT